MNLCEGILFCGSFVKNMPIIQGILGVIWFGMIWMDLGWYKHTIFDSCTYAVGNLMHTCLSMTYPINNWLPRPFVWPWEAYPMEYLVLSSVMLVPWFLSVHGTWRHANQREQRNWTGYKIMVMGWFMDWVLKPPWDPLDSSHTHDSNWESGIDAKEYIFDNYHKIVHRVGHGETYDDEYSGIRNWRDTTTMKLGTTNNKKRIGAEMTALNSLTKRTIAHVPLACSSTINENLIIDTGASTSFSNCRDDFIIMTEINEPTQGFTGDGTAKGVGLVKWQVIDKDGKQRELITDAVYVPNGTRRLFSPQRHFQRYDSIFNPNGPTKKTCPGSFTVTSKIMVYRDPEGWVLEGDLNHNENLPIWQLFKNDVDKHNIQANNQMEPWNLNLTRPEKELLLWHNRMGHLGFRHVQQLMQGDDECKPILPTKHKTTKSITPPKCEACMYGKQKRTGAGAQRVQDISEKEMSLRRNDLKPGDCVSIDHYESTLRGRTLGSRGREPWHKRYCGGTIFVDHASSFIATEHQVSLGASDTILSKRRFEQDARQMGVTISEYHGDNGVFVAEEFREELAELDQDIKFSGVGAHHQNAVAERAIQTIMSRARTVLLYASLMWPEETEANLWPFAVDYVTFLWNHTPRADTGKSPIEIFSSSLQDHSILGKTRVWGSPVYVLDPKLQDGHKIPKWQPRSRRGQYVGISKEHASNIGLIRNIKTGYISPQFHLIYDELFQTVTRSDDQIKAELWIDLVKNEREHLLDDDTEKEDMRRRQYHV